MCRCIIHVNGNFAIVYLNQRQAHVHSVAIDSNVVTLIVFETRKARPTLNKWLLLVTGFFCKLVMSCNCLMAKWICRTNLDLLTVLTAVQKATPGIRELQCVCTKALILQADNNSVAVGEALSNLR